jgi:D-threonate/D-erythronate kinase
VTSVRALADDLSGALDAGAAFVGMCGPLSVGWRDDFAPQSDSYVIDNETRHEDDLAIVADRTRRHLQSLVGANHAFKKIDSLMRGHTIAEITTCIESRCFASVVVAPAFPQQRRITKGGQQFADLYGNQEWLEAGPNLTGALRTSAAANTPVQQVAVDTVARGSGVFVCDAATDAEMQSLPARVEEIERPILWCGTAGLAHVLAGASLAPCALPLGSALVVIGSNHPVSRRQVEALTAIMPQSVRNLDCDLDRRALWQFLDNRLRSGEVAMMAANFGAIDGKLARGGLVSAFRDVLPRLPIADLVLVAGGETLLLVLDAVAAQSAVVEGEVMPGVARGRVVGGVWDGAVFASKSGAFGAPAALVDLLASRRSGEFP